MAKSFSCRRNGHSLVDERKVSLLSVNVGLHQDNWVTRGEVHIKITYSCRKVIGLADISVIMYKSGRGLQFC